MAANCPKCGAPVEHDFGVTPCENCGVVLFVDFDGGVQMSVPETQEDIGASASQPIPALEESAGQNPFEIPAEDLAFLTSEDSASDGLAHAPGEYDVNESETYEASIESPPFEAAAYETDEGVGENLNYVNEEIVVEAADLAENVDAADPAASGDSGFAEWNPDDGVQSAHDTEPVKPASDGMLDFSDVVDFANRGELDNSPLVYRLRIEGIDHRDIRRKVESVLADPKLNFHMKDVLPLIKGGVLELTDLPPVKASVIATRLREESVQFFWVQSAFQSGEEGAYNETGT